MTRKKERDHEEPDVRGTGMRIGTFAPCVAAKSP